MSLSKGGAERSNAIISKILDSSNYDVTIISILDSIDFQYGGTYLSLESKVNTSLSYFHRKYSKFNKAKSIFENNNFDVIVDARTRPIFIKEFLIQKLIYKKTPIIYLVHGSFLKHYFNTIFFSRLLYKNKTIVSVSKEVTQKIKSKFNLKKVITIYNSFETSLIPIDKKTIDYEYILFYGRIDNNSKNLFFLINAYNQSTLADRKIKLVILGEGPDLKELKIYASKTEKSNSIIFKPFESSPFYYVKNALFTVMTSNYEGFPMTIIESMSLGVPVVSLNFKSGPSEVIETGKNGILVDSKKISDFSNALNKMIENNSFYLSCKSGAKNSVEKFKKQYISKQWIKLIESL